MCDFSEIVESRQACLSARDAHVEAEGADHAVAFEVIDESPFLRGAVANLDEALLR